LRSKTVTILTLQLLITTFLQVYIATFYTHFLQV